jgi:hypothetical protein
VIRSTCSKVDLVGLVVNYGLWCLTTHCNRVYLALPDTHQILLGSTVVRELATKASDEGTCQPGYQSNVVDLALLIHVIFS